MDIAFMTLAETGKMKTYSDAIEAILSKSVILSPELLSQVGSLTKTNSQLGYSTKEEFIDDPILFRLIGLHEGKVPICNSRKRRNRTQYTGMHHIFKQIKTIKNRSE
jgi:hypothetical protein